MDNTNPITGCRGDKHSKDKHDQRPEYTKHSHHTNWRPREHQYQHTPDSRVLSPDQTKGISTNMPDKDKRDNQPTSTIHMDNDSLEKRERIPPKKFMMDFRSPDLRKKRTIRETEEETEYQEDPIQQKRKR
ncbi:Hypothetical predicted protein [Pelobates cultripes]|uniref:Uncharacterized protein n=1 Tax=Pelobates cultripes TaxID=61616 RepID=A0AAD1VP45_PELCU|nr:Hypothetical predicted protein [Pelobates cultripes]